MVYKLPNKIKISLEKEKRIDKEMENNNKLNSLLMIVLILKIILNL